MQLVESSGSFDWLDAEEDVYSLENGKEEGIKEGLEAGRKTGLQEAISLGLELKFGIESLILMDSVYKTESIGKLEMIKETIKRAKTIDEIIELLKNQ